MLACALGHAYGPQPERGVFRTTDGGTSWERVLFVDEHTGYDVTALIGEGGMGQVYRARDTKLDRDVALKILPDAFVNDAERLARFQREAEVLASLNHPNIAAIYGLEEGGESPALVLAYVEGPMNGRREG